MDDESNQLLREIRDMQKEQLEIIRRALQPQFKFSLRTLLVVLTFVAVFLGMLTFLGRPARKTTGHSNPLA